MSIRMAKLNRSKNGDFVSRKGIPADVRDAYSRLHRLAAQLPARITKAGGNLTVPKVWEELFKPPGARPHQLWQELRGRNGARKSIPGLRAYVRCGCEGRGATTHEHQRPWLWPGVGGHGS